MSFEVYLKSYKQIFYFTNLENDFKKCKYFIFYSSKIDFTLPKSSKSEIDWKFF